MTVTPPSDVPSEVSAVRHVPRWMWIVLVLSVAVNLVIAGMAISAMLHFRKGHGGPMSGFARYVDTLPEERRADLKRLLDAHRDRIRPLRRRLRKARRRARDVFKSEPFVRDELAKAYADVAEARTALTKERQDLFPNLAGLLTVEERREFLYRHHHRRRYRRHRHRVD